MDLTDPAENERCNRFTLHDCYEEPFIGWCSKCHAVAMEVRDGSGCCGAEVLDHDPKEEEDEQD